MSFFDIPKAQPFDALATKGGYATLPSRSEMAPHPTKQSMH